MVKDFYTKKDIFAVAREEAEVSNILNNDAYKFYMLDFILAHPEYSDIEVEWKMTVRSKDVKTIDVIPKEQLINQLKMTQNIAWVWDEDIEYLRSMTQKSWDLTFREETLEFLKNFKLSDFSVEDDWKGNYDIKFKGPWKNSMMWEIFGLKIINTLYLYNYIEKEKLSPEEFNKIIQITLSRLVKDIEIFKTEPDTVFSEFGTRRAMSTDFQRIVNWILENELPDQYLWTSNVLVAKEMWHPKAIWTNAHELRMIPSALYDDPQDIINEMYEIDRKWQEHYPEMALLLPDTYWTSFYLKHATDDIIVNHTWNRFDSKDPMDAIPEYIDWLLENWQDPLTKSWIPSDWLNAQKAVDITRKFKGKLWSLSYWIGTNFTNNTKWTWPRENEPHGPFWSFSVVIKPSKVKRPDWKWVSTVKLSDNPEKAVWDKQRVKKYIDIFWSEGSKDQEVLV